MANINKIKLSGTTYNIQDLNAAKTVELTQAQYDALVSGGTVDPNTFYIITDAQGGDLSNYYTKSETSGATQISTALASKADTATTYTKTGTDNAITAATSTKQDTLVSGTNIKTINNESILGSGNITIQGGGGGVNVVQTTGTSTTDVMSQNAVTTQLSGYVTTDTEQIISGRKIFTYTANSDKAIEFKQTDDSTKLGFRVRTSAATNNELASFEFRPNTFKIGGVQHPLLYFGHYRNTNVADAGVPQTVIGYRQYDQLNNAAYHYLIPLPERAKIPFSLTTKFRDYYAPIGFKNGSTMITADDTGVVNLTDAFNGKLDTSFFNTYRGLVNTALSGKQNTLSAGTGIDITDNVISATGGGGGGKAVSGGTNISVTTGETADTINCTLPIRTDGTYSGKGIIFGSGINMYSKGACSIVGGNRVSASTNANYSVGLGSWINLSNENEFGCGTFTKTNRASSTFGNSGNTLFSVGNGTADNARHNAFEVRQNGDIYCSDGTNDVKLQDTIKATAANTTALGGLSLVKLTQAQYDALATKNDNTVYFIGDSTNGYIMKIGSANVN